MSATRRRQFFLLLALMVLGAVAELAAIGAVIPFLSLLADPGGLSASPWAEAIFAAVGADTRSERLIASTALFSVLVIAAGILRLQLAWMTQDFIFRLGHELAVDIQRRILSQPYSFHTDNNTSTLLASIDKTEILIFEVLLPQMQAATAGFIAVFIIAALIYIDPFTAMVAAGAFSFIYVVVSRFSRGRLAANSNEMAEAWDERLKIAQESLGGIRDVIIDNSQAMHLRLFERANSRLSVARASTAFLSSAPRFIIETVGMVVIAVIALIIAEREAGLAAALPILGAIALGAQRLLPLLQQVYSAWSNVAGNRSIMVEVLGLLRLPLGEGGAERAPVAPLPLRDKVSLEKLAFSYPTRRRPVIDGVTLEIPAGAAVALIGETGSGKSTLADLLMGLLEPDEGRICVDGVPLTAKNRRRWQGSIAHVPQSIFLADASIARNISLGRHEEEIDLERVVEAARTAQLHDFVTSLPDGYDTIVGERGIRLSGGQRQRLGIARAIYKRAPMLVLDEATSALDDATEAAVMDGLHELGAQGRTIIVIAHRASTVARCDIVARLRNGRIVEIRNSRLREADAR